MSNHASGWIVAVLILGSIAGFLFFNLETRPPRKPSTVKTVSPIETAPKSAVNTPTGGMVEYSIGDDVEQNHLHIAAVWLPSVHLFGTPDASNDVIHLEADVRSGEGNPNGFAKDEFVPYLVIHYTITPASGGEPLTGTLVPMVARDGLHYGASVRMPGPGAYKLTYAIDPPSKGGLGRHDDPATGVAGWWEPFRVSFDWDYEPVTPTNPAASMKPAGATAAAPKQG